MRYGLAVIIIIFLAIVGTVVLIGSNNSSSGSIPVRETVLADYNSKDSSSISWTQQGRLTGEDQRKSIRITVTRSKRTVEILDGYAERVEKSSEYVNSPDAYTAFTLALDNLNFGRERNVKEPDERGVCPSGSRFIYRVTDMGSEIMRTWSDSCQPADGPFGGGKTAPVIAKLFKEQITDYTKFISGVKL